MSMDKTSTWPQVGRETLEWKAIAPQWGAPSSRTRGPVTYEGAVVPEIATCSPMLDPDTSQEADEAARELTRLDSALGERLASLSPILLRSEAASSSQIENLTASARAVLGAELGARTGGNAKEIVANTRMMTAALDLANELTVDAILRMHATLMEGQAVHPTGRWRDEAVWIGTWSDSPRGAEYVAPHHRHVPGLMEDLVAFMARTDLPPLAHVALTHAQFETIHPFTDGNGRTGRALVQAMLRARGVTRNVAVPVSAGLLAEVGGYHRALMAYREGRPEEIVQALSRAALRAVVNTRQLVEDIDGIREGWDERLTARRTSGAWRLLDLAARRPVIDAAMAADFLGSAPQNVYPALAALTDAGILIATKEYRLGTLWRSDEVLAAIDSFAARAGRREAP